MISLRECGTVLSDLAASWFVPPGGPLLSLLLLFLVHSGLDFLKILNISYIKQRALGTVTFLTKTGIGADVRKLIK
jgi:hypothetical protein